MKVTLTPKVEKIVASQIASGNFASMDEAVNSLILSTQDIIDHRLDGLGEEISQRIGQSDSDDIEVDRDFFTDLRKRCV
ncbi:MAG: hypothetical protein HQL69_15800 [Magnetococcales bacterium]|nr:hypothetical protein [Magnetococcales bacterium]